MKLVIDRSKWIRGDRSCVRLLRSGDGHMCCLGFYGLACGFSRDELADKSEPNEVAEYRKWPEWMVEEIEEFDKDEKGAWFSKWNDSDDAGNLIAANDSETIGASRESRIATIFAKHGVEVEFVDGPVSP